MDNSNLTLYDLLKAQVAAGAVVVKIDPLMEDTGDIWVTDTKPDPLTKEWPYKKFYVMGRAIFPYFKTECMKKGVTIIPLEHFIYAAQEKFRQNRQGECDDQGLETQGLPDESKAICRGHP